MSFRAKAGSLILKRDSMSGSLLSSMTSPAGIMYSLPHSPLLPPSPLLLPSPPLPPDRDLPSHTGISDPDSVGYRKRRRFLELVNELVDTGVGLDIDLPQIAVLGSQSSGKSSLIEGISGITLPRASGTCTRCPILCRLQSGVERWSCRIHLLLTVDESGRPLQLAQKVSFGAPIFDKKDVQKRIEQAQKAILYPNIDPSAFLSASFTPSEDIAPLRFSQNVVSVEISGEGVDDLGFIDLPGIIAQDEDGYYGDVEIVKGLATNFIKNPSCLILLTITCETDLENQGAGQLAKEFDPDFERTIGVLTKPDRIEEGNERVWHQILRKRDWFCVKQPNSLELQRKISWEEARHNEKDYFKTNDYWRGVERRIQDRMGTNSLAHHLGIRLFDLIEKSFEDIRKTISDELRETKAALSKLPPVVGPNPVSYMMNLLSKFSFRLAKVVGGDPTEENSIVRPMRTLGAQYMETIQSLAPRFRPYKKGDVPELATQLSPGEEGSPGLPPDYQFGQPAPLENLNSFPEYPRSLETLRLWSSEEIAPIVFLDEVLDRAEGCLGRELPGDYPPSIKMHFISKSIELWLEPTSQLCTDIYEKVQVMVESLVKEIFGGFHHGGLTQLIHQTAENHIEQCYERAQEAAERLHQLEIQSPTTRDRHEYLHFQREFLVHYRTQRHINGPEGAIHRQLAEGTVSDPRLRAILASLQELGLEAAPQDLLKLVKGDHTENALGIMAGCRAYYHIAARRFADYVVMNLDKELVLDLEYSLRLALNDALPLSEDNSKTQCLALLEHPPDIVQRREELLNKESRLEAAGRKLGIL